MEEIELCSRLPHHLPFTEDLPSPTHHISVPRVPVGSRVSITTTASSVASTLSLPAGRGKTYRSIHADEILTGDGPSSISPNGWKPVCLRLPYLLLLAFLHIASLAVVEIPLRIFPKQESAGHRASFDGEDGGQYFLWQFLPIIWVTGLDIMWDALDENIRRFQPFFLMAGETGASCKDSLTADYVTSFAYSTPFRAAWHKHWMVFLSCTGHLLALAGLPALAGQMWNMTWSIEDTAAVEFQVKWVRCFQAANGLLVAVIIVIFIMLRRRQPGLVRDPGGAANIASLICQSQPLLALLQRVPSYASHKHIESYLEQPRFYLRSVHDRNGPLQICIDWPKDGKRLGSPSDPYKPSRSEAHPFCLWGRTTLVVALVLLIPNLVVRTAHGNYTVSTFKPFVVKGAFTLVYATYTAVYQAIQHELAVLEPYYQMRDLHPRDRKRHSPLALNYTPRSLPWMPLLALLTSAKILACASVVVLFQQISMIFFPPIWTTIYENRLRGIYLLAPVFATPAWILFGTSLVALASGIITGIAMFRYRRKSIMPRQARTLASQMIYLCGSTDLLRSMQGTSSMSEKEFRDHCNDLGRDHGFGWFQSEDGQWRIGIEEVEKVKYLYRYPETTAPERYE